MVAQRSLSLLDPFRTPFMLHSYHLNLSAPNSQVVWEGSCELLR